MSVSTLCCDACGGPVSYQAPFCPYCSAALLWDKQLDVERGAVVIDLDFRRDPLPTKPKRKVRTRARDDGVAIQVDKETMEWAPVGRPLRDGCVAVRGTCLDASGSFGVVARVREAGKSAMVYEVDVFPGFRSYEVQRNLIGPTSHLDRLLPWEYCPAIGGVGTFTELELRFADSLFQVLINGQRVASFVEAYLGFGNVGWHASGVRAPTEVVLQSFRAFQAR